MNLPPRALQALVNLKKELLDRDSADNAADNLTAPSKLNRRVKISASESGPRMRNARSRGARVQRMFQRREFA